MYEQILGIPYYVVYSRYTDELRAFELAGGRYRKLELADNRIWLPEIKLFLGLWRGLHRNCERRWLRWFDANGNLIPSPDEKSELEKLRADQEKQRAEKEKTGKEIARRQLREKDARIEQLLAKLRSAGIDPDT